MSAHDLTDRELATVVFALRNMQPLVDHEDSRRELAEEQEHFADQEPLTAAEIDALCERLNAERIA
jgi:hypothetical protein